MFFYRKDLFLFLAHYSPTSSSTCRNLRHFICSWIQNQTILIEYLGYYCPSPEIVKSVQLGGHRPGFYTGKRPGRALLAGRSGAAFRACLSAKEERTSAGLAVFKILERGRGGEDYIEFTMVTCDYSMLQNLAGES